MDYHKSATPLRLREFGRNVQTMVELAIKEEDINRRTQMANEIIRIMSAVAPSTRELADAKETLWDYLFKMSNYELEVDAPFQMKIPSPAKTSQNKVPYYVCNTKMKQYGKNIELMVKKVSVMVESSQKQRAIQSLATLMKHFLQLNQGGGNLDEIVAEHLHILSNGALQIKDGVPIPRLRKNNNNNLQRNRNFERPTDNNYRSNDNYRNEPSNRDGGLRDSNSRDSRNEPSRNREYRGAQRNNNIKNNSNYSNVNKKNNRGRPAHKGAF